MNHNTSAHASDYTDEGFWSKVKGFALTAGRGLVEQALWLHGAAQRPETPLWAKTTIFGALGYFISPIDVIPDALPIVGFTDDLGVIVAALGAVRAYVTDEVKRQAAEKLAVWFH